MQHHDDPWLWLEQIDTDEARAWVDARNAATEAELQADPRFAPLCERLTGILDSSAKIPYVGVHGGWCYNFWRDATHVRGVWRRTTLDEYRNSAPDWETVLDLDALARTEN